MTTRPDNVSDDDWKAMPESMRVMMASMKIQAERAGVDMPALDEKGQMKLPPPAVSLYGRPSVITRRVAEIAAGAGLYLMNDDLVLIDSLTGKVKLMTPAIFREWIDNHCVIYKKKKDDADEGAKPIACWMPHDIAGSMLASPDFRSKVPRVSRINMVRLPTLRKPAKEGEAPRTELLPEGYDVESETFTVKGLTYPEDTPSSEAMEWIRELLPHFDWAMTDKEQEKGTQPTFGRSFAVFMTAALTCYCETMFPPGVTKPMFLFNANEPGSGKTLLGQLCLYAVHGFIGFVRWRENEEELIKTLDANARWMRPALFLDDVSGHIKSELLNQWLTEPMHEGRVIGTGDWFSVPRVGITVMTGNGVSLERDINRRSLMIDLFMTVSAREKVRPKDAVALSHAWILRPENRRKWLAAMWAFVRDFAHAERPKDWRPLETFEDWSEVVVPIVRKLCLPDPLEPYTPPDAGDQSGDDVAKLMKVVIEELCIKEGRQSAKVTLADLVPLARRHGLFVNVLGTAEDAYRAMSANKSTKWREVIWEEGNGTETREPVEAEKKEQALGWMPADNKMATSFGMRFGKRATGKEPSVGGKRWRFGKRGSSKTATYEIQLVS